MADAILALNAGSSSIKFSLFETDEGDRMKLAVRGELEEIDSGQHFVARDPAGAVLAEERWSGQSFAPLVAKVIAWAERHLEGSKLIAVGHRVVHGGPDYDRPQRVTPELLAKLDRLTPLAPLHEPRNLAPIRAIAAERADLLQVACFDTAFHHTMPPVATRFALPRAYEADGVRRYGFHGLSYEYLSRRMRELAPELANGRVIAAHLGNGASLCAMLDGRSIDTTMGFTALDGLVMGTRCGNIDPGVILYLEQERGFTAKEIEDLLYRKSGLLGVSGISSDMRTLLASCDRPARDAIELFVFRIAREVGALTSSLEGLDTIIFSAGIGEHAPEIRAMVCARLEWLGVALDMDANGHNAAVISSASSRVVVRVIPTDEEAMIARHVLETIGASDKTARLAV
jgi:acetate kinase